MAVTGPCYCTREDVKTALDIKESARVNDQIDRALAGARDSVETLCNRKFYPQAATRVFDWPNFQRAYPWRLWLNQHEAISVSALVSGGVTITAGQYFLEPANEGPPFTRIDLNRATVAAFTSAATPQHSVSVTGVFGYRADTAPAGVLAAALTDPTGTAVTVSSGAGLGAGSSVLVDSERMLVTKRAMADTTVAFTGLFASAADNVITVPDGTKFAAGELLAADTERMLLTDVTGNQLTVKRAWDGTVLAVHTSGTLFAARALTVVRGALGTTAATHSNAAPVVLHVYPGLVWELSVAESINLFLQETSGYARTVGSGDNIRQVSGAGLADLRTRCLSAFGRKNRQRTI